MYIFIFTISVPRSGVSLYCSSVNILVGGDERGRTTHEMCNSVAIWTQVTMHFEPIFLQLLELPAFCLRIAKMGDTVLSEIAASVEVAELCSGCANGTDTDASAGPGSSGGAPSRLYGGSVATQRRARLRRRARTRPIAVVLCVLAGMREDLASAYSVFGRHVASTLEGTACSARAVIKDVLPLPLLASLPCGWPPDCGRRCWEPLRVLTNLSVAGLNYLHVGGHPHPASRTTNAVQRSALRSIAGRWWELAGHLSGAGVDVLPPNAFRTLVAKANGAQLCRWSLSRWTSQRVVLWWSRSPISLTTWHVWSRALLGYFQTESVASSQFLVSSERVPSISYCSGDNFVPPRSA